MKIQTRQLTRQAGFSLAELMVVIVIISLLATLVLPNILGKLAQAQVAKAKADINTIDQGLTDFAVLNGNRYPESLEVLVTPDENGFTFFKQRPLPDDPWDNPYVYEPPSPGEPRPRIVSYGRDGEPGGEGYDSDLDNWGEDES